MVTLAWLGVGGVEAYVAHGLVVVASHRFRDGACGRDWAGRISGSTRSGSERRPAHSPVAAVGHMNLSTSYVSSEVHAPYVSSVVHP